MGIEKLRQKGKPYHESRAQAHAENNFPQLVQPIEQRAGERADAAEAQQQKEAEYHGRQGGHHRGQPCHIAGKRGFQQGERFNVGEGQQTQQTQQQGHGFVQHRHAEAHRRRGGKLPQKLAAAGHAVLDTHGEALPEVGYHGDRHRKAGNGGDPVGGQGRSVPGFFDVNKWHTEQDREELYGDNDGIIALQLFFVNAEMIAERRKNLHENPLLFRNWSAE